MPSLSEGNKEQAGEFLSKAYFIENLIYRRIHFNLKTYRLKHKISSDILQHSITSVSREFGYRP